MRIRLAITLGLGLLSAACGGSGIPAKTVVLTFDDAVVNHLTTVAPILEKHGFGATFFVTPRFRQEYGDAYLDWDGIAELSRKGFEIGNHSFGHVGFDMPANLALMPKDLSVMEDRLVRVGVPKPVSFAWPGDVFSPGARAILEDAGYRFARRGIAPDVTDGSLVACGPAYDPKVNDPLLVPTTATVGAAWMLEDFQRAVAKAVPGRAVVIQFHGVPDPLNRVLSVSPRTFARWMDWLDEEGCRVVALRDLDPYVDRANLPDDPLDDRTWPPPEGGAVPTTRPGDDR